MKVHDRTVRLDRLDNIDPRSPDRRALAVRAVTDLKRKLDRHTIRLMPMRGLQPEIVRLRRRSCDHDARECGALHFGWTGARNGNLVSEGGTSSSWTPSSMPVGVPLTSSERYALEAS